MSQQIWIISRDEATREMSSNRTWLMRYHFCNSEIVPKGDFSLFEVRHNKEEGRDYPGNNVGINNREAFGFEEIGDGALPACYAASQTNHPHLYGRRWETAAGEVEEWIGWNREQVPR